LGGIRFALLCFASLCSGRKWDEDVIAENVHGFLSTDRP